MRILRLLPIAILALAGLAAGFAATGHRRPEPRPGEVGIHRDPLRIQRSASNPMLVTEAQWMELPMLREDFDLLLDLELGEGAEADLVLRRVESRPLQGVALGHHSRFAVLRMSTVAAGEPWRTPATALFGPAGGVRLGSGMAATVRVEARGRELRANVAGRILEPFFAEDDHGSLALITRGGVAAVHSLQLEPVARAGQETLQWLGVAIGLGLGLLAALRRAGPVPAAVAGVAWVGAAACSSAVAASGLPPLAQLDPGDEAIALLCGLPVAAALAVAGRAANWFGVLGLVAIAVAARWSHGEVRARFASPAELDAVFGTASRETATEALARRVRGPLATHTLSGPPVRVFLLGGQLLYRRGPAPDQHVEPLLLGELVSVRKRPAPDVDVVSLPTEDGFTTQQVEMFDRCFRAYAPKVIVLGVPRDEDVEVDDGPRSSPKAVQAAIGRMRAIADGLGAKLVLLADDGLPADLRAVLDSAHSGGLPLVVVESTDAAVGIARKLAAVIEPLLPTPN